MESSGGEQSNEQGPKWRAEDSTAAVTIFRSLSRKGQGADARQPKSKLREATESRFTKRPS